MHQQDDSVSVLGHWWCRTHGWTTVRGASAEPYPVCDNCGQRVKEFAIVPADSYRGAVDALHEAIQLARDFNRGAMTWKEYDRKLAALEAAHPRGSKG